MDDEHETSALHSRRKNIKSSMTRLSCCFSRGAHRRGRSFDVSSAMSPSTWIRSKPNHHDQLPSPPENKGKYKKIIPQMGRHRRHSSAEFSYDPLSYALNFEDVSDDTSDWDQEPLRSFSSRLPASPPRDREIRSEAATIEAERPSPPAGMMNWPRTSELPASRALAVAEVRKSLELEELSTPGQANPTFELPMAPPRIEASRRSAEVGEIRRSPGLSTPGRKVAEPASKSIERSTPRAAAVAVVRRSLEDVKPPSHSPQVLVELF